MPKQQPYKSVTAVVSREMAEHLKRFCKSSGLKQKFAIGLAIRDWLGKQDLSQLKEKP